MCVLLSNEARGFQFRLLLQQLVHIRVLNRSTQKAWLEALSTTWLSQTSKSLVVIEGGGSPVFTP